MNVESDREEQMNKQKSPKATPRIDIILWSGKIKDIFSSETKREMAEFQEKMDRWLKEARNPWSHLRLRSGGYEQTKEAA